jgi:hypothetical protein
MLNGISLLEHRCSLPNYSKNKLNSNQYSPCTDFDFLSEFQASGISDRPTLKTEDISPIDFRQSIQDRCPIAPELFGAAIDFVEDSELWETYETLNWRVSRDWQTRKPHRLGILACFKQESGEVWQAKPEFPLPDKNGKPRKYETPVGVGSRSLLSSVPLSLWQTIADRYRTAVPDWVTTEIALGRGGSRSSGFWAWVEQHPEIPIVVTEGGFKALAALDRGYVCLSLYGVNSGVSKWETIAGERLRKLNPSLIPDLQRFAVQGRRVVIAFDQDIAAKTRVKVAGAMADLSWHLGQSGCDVTIASWDDHGGEFKGLDDLIFGAGDDAWHSAYDAGIPATQWRIQRELTRAVRRSPDLNIGDREFSDVADELPLTGLVILHGGKGTGKSKAIGAMLRDRSWLSFTPLISLGRSQAESWRGVFLNDGDLAGDRLLKDGSPVAGAAVCLPSLPKVARVQPEVVIIDETTAALEFLLNSPLSNRQGIRPLLISEHDRQVLAADLVVLADADLTEEAIAHYEAITGNRAFYVRSERQALPYSCGILEGTQNQAIAAFTQRVEALAEGQIIYLNTDSKRLADSITEMLARTGVRSLLITSETSGGDLEKAFLGSQGTLIPELIGQGVRVVISSPTIAQGFSVENHTDLIDSVWGFYSGGSISAHGIAQSLDRVRSSEVPRFIQVAKRGRACSKLSRAVTASAFTREFKQLSTTAARLARLSLTPEAATGADRVDWESVNIKTLGALEVRRNRGMAALRDTVIALLSIEGKQVQTLKPIVTKAEARAAGQALKAGSQAIQQAHAQVVAVAASLTDIEANRLSSQTEALTPDQVLSLEKYYLAQFYRREVDADLVLFDRTGATRQEIRNLERLLNFQTAIDRTASTINQSCHTPQDWSRAAVRSWLYQESGFSEFVREIVAGQVVEIRADRTAGFVNFVRSHREEFKLCFGIGVGSNLSDQQIIGELLRSLGIRTKRHRRKNTYSIQNDRLAVVLEILERRKRIDPPLPASIKDQAGGSDWEVLPIGWTEHDISELRAAIEQSPELKPLLRQTTPLEIWKLVA